MPLVRIRYRDLDQLDRLAQLQLGIRIGVAKALSSDDEGGALAEQDIEVQFDPASLFDANGSAFMVDIEAVNYPGRLANQQERCEQIRKLFLDMLRPDVPSFGIWLKLLPAAYAEYEPPR